jgi:hypothetical protein
MGAAQKSETQIEAKVRTSAARERFGAFADDILLTEVETAQIVGFSANTLKFWRLNGSTKGPAGNESLWSRPLSRRRSAEMALSLHRQCWRRRVRFRPSGSAMFWRTRPTPSETIVEWERQGAR